MIWLFWVKPNKAECAFSYIVINRTVSFTASNIYDALTMWQALSKTFYTQDQKFMD